MVVKSCEHDDQLYIYIYIYICVCVCVCVYAGRIWQVYKAKNIKIALSFPRVVCILET